MKIKLCTLRKIIREEVSRSLREGAEAVDPNVVEKLKKLTYDRNKVTVHQIMARMKVSREGSPLLARDIEIFDEQIPLMRDAGVDVNFTGAELADYLRQAELQRTMSPEEEERLRKNYYAAKTDTYGT